jgi:hypothetical protein
MHNQLCNEILIKNGVDTTRFNTREPGKGSRRRNSEVSRVKRKQLFIFEARNLQNELVDGA